MKILQVTNFYKPSWESGGPARVAYEISRNLVERRHEVTVYTTDGFKWRLNVVKNKPVIVDGIKTYYFRNLSGYLASKVLPTPYYAAIIAKKEIKNFDIIHIHENNTLGFIVHHYAKKYKIPYVLQGHGSLLFQMKGKKKLIGKIWNSFFERPTLYDASKVIALTETEAEQIKNIGIPRNKIEVVPNGINLSEYESLPEKGEFRKKYSIRDDEKIILYLGRLHQIKGIDLLVNAFSSIKKESNGVKLVIAGPDDGFLSSLKKQSDDLKLGDKIIFTGPLYDRNKLEAYVDADVYVLPSVYEIFGITVLEACACGIPVIVTNRSGITDFVENVGYVVKYDADQLKDTIIKLLNDAELRRNFGENGKLLVRKDFTWDKFVNRFEDIYESVIEENVGKGSKNL